MGAWRSNLTSKPWKVRALTQVRFSQKIQKTDEGDLTTRTLSGKWHPVLVNQWYLASHLTSAMSDGMLLFSFGEQCSVMVND